MFHINERSVSLDAASSTSPSATNATDVDVALEILAAMADPSTCGIAAAGIVCNLVVVAVVLQLRIKLRIQRRLGFINPSSGGTKQASQ